MLWRKIVRAFCANIAGTCYSRLLEHKPGGAQASLKYDVGDIQDRRWADKQEREKERERERERSEVSEAYVVMSLCKQAVKLAREFISEPENSLLVSLSHTSSSLLCSPLYVQWSERATFKILQSDQWESVFARPFYLLIGSHLRLDQDLFSTWQRWRRSAQRRLSSFCTQPWDDDDDDDGEVV